MPTHGATRAPAAGRAAVTTGTLRSVVRGVRERAHRSDVMLVAAALTCYAALGYIPLVAIGSRVAAAVLGRRDVVRTGAGVAGYLHGGLHVDRVVEALPRSASTMSWWYVLAALLPVSLFAEGTVRCLERFSRAPERHGRSVRGRLLAPVLVAVSAASALLFCGVVRPLLFDPFGTGAGARLLGVLVAFNILFFPILATLAVVYRLFATTPLRPLPVLLGAGAAASWLASQALAYVLVVRWVSGIGPRVRRLRAGWRGGRLRVPHLPAEPGAAVRLPARAAPA